MDFNSFSFIRFFVVTKKLNNVFVIKPNKCTNFTNSFCHEFLPVSESSSVHHQEFIHCTLSSVICRTGLKTAFEEDLQVLLESCLQTV